MPHNLKLWQVDAFTDQPFKGNPAAVFVIDAPLSDELMQNIAIEMNLSESAFVLMRAGEDPLLRWFTPMDEIDLCGHATLASAHILMTEIDPTLEEIVFDTKFVGPLKVERRGKSYTMDFPARMGERMALKDIAPWVTEAVSETKPREAYLSRDLMLVYEDEQVVREMTPNYNSLMDFDKFIIVTAPSDGQPYDFVSRFFCAADGIAEDPVTGSAHCTSAPYWSQRLGKTQMKAYQASRRGGILDLEVTPERVFMTGNAVTVMKGSMAL